MGCVLHIGVGVGAGVGVDGCVCGLCFVGVDVFGAGFGVGCFVGGVGGGCFGGGGVMCFGVVVVVLLGSCPVLFPKTDGGLLWGNLSPVSFPETDGGFLSGNLPRGLFVAHGRPAA